MSELLLSVSGARGIVGVTMTPAVAASFAAAYAAHAAALRRTRRPVLLLGRDGRPSGAELAAAAAAGARSAGATVTDLGVAATPTVSFMVRRSGADGGLVVTASHNPIEYNGLKCLDAEGTAPPPEQAAAIIERFRKGSEGSGFPFRQPKREPGSLVAPGAAGQAASLHVEGVLELVDVAMIRAARFRVVLDSCGGAGAEPGRLLLEALGCELVHFNSGADGRCDHGLEPLEANLIALAKATAARGAAAGFAQDPDADRLAIVDDRGRYIGEECTLVIAARRLLDVRGGGPVVVNLSTSRMIDDLCAVRPGAGVHRTAVGEANVAAAMKRLGSFVGGEGNGGVIVPEVCWARDSHVAMGLALDTLAAEKRPLSAIVDGLPRYAMVKRKLDLPVRDAVAAMIERVAARFAAQRVDRTDGVRVDFADGWVHLRGSNTEPIVRLIAEAKTVERANALLEDVTRAAGM